MNAYVSSNNLVCNKAITMQSYPHCLVLVVVIVQGIEKRKLREHVRLK